MDQKRVREIVREELAKLMAAGLRRPGISGDPPAAQEARERVPNEGAA